MSFCSSFEKSEFVFLQNLLWFIANNIQFMASRWKDATYIQRETTSRRNAFNWWFIEFSCCCWQFWCVEYFSCSFVYPKRQQLWLIRCFHQWISSHFRLIRLGSWDFRYSLYSFIFKPNVCNVQTKSVQAFVNVLLTSAIWKWNRRNKLITNCLTIITG